jgi:raffinose/stachyose/melibiose transport system permease protein
MLTMIGGGGVTLLFFVAYIKQIPREFDEAASMDGCSYFMYLRRILVPLMKPAIASMAILMSIGVWNEILNSVIFLSEDAYSPITRGLYIFKGLYSVQWNQLAAAMLIVAAPVVLLYIFLQKLIIDGVVAGGVKE